MEKKYESAYAQYVHKKPKTHWSSESDVKSKLLKVDLTSEHMEYGGLPIISDGKTAYIDASDSHTAIGAISGMKKSICGFMPLMCVLGKTDERIIATDPKGELYERMAGYLVACGKKVWCLDLSRATSFTICEDTWFTTFRPIILKRKRSCSEKLLV